MKPERPASSVAVPAPLRPGVAATGIAMSGVLGLLPGTTGWFSAVGFFAWLALWALPGGFLSGSCVRGLPVLLPIGLWAVLGLALDRAYADPLGGVLAVAALHALGFALGRILPGRALAGTGVALLAVGLLAALPSGGGVLEHPWPPALTARLLDLSPLVWVFEAAGVDWMRHPSVYEIAGAGDLGPDLRVAWAGWRAALPGLVIATATAFVATRFPGTRRSA